MNKLFLFLMRFLFFILIVHGAAETYAQRISRQSINALGSQHQSASMYIRQTVGQAYQSRTVTDGLMIRSGFQQPTSFKIKSDRVKSSLKSPIAVFPNPATTSLFVTSTESIENATLRIMDIQGNQMLEKQIDSFRKEEISCGEWVEGVYFMTLTSPKKKVYTSKLIITK